MPPTGGSTTSCFDTAPTGHTLRLLQLPGSWTEYLTAGGDASCLGPLSGLEQQKTAYAEAVRALTDPLRTRLVLATRAQRSSIDEIDRTFAELAAIGMDGAHVVINGILPGAAGDEPIAAAVRARESAAIAAMPSALAALPLDRVELQPSNMVGIEALSTLFAPAAPPAPTEGAPPDPGAGAPLSALVDEIERDGHGLVMCMGKGGVGKTTIAAAIAVSLAQRGHEVLLTTTDPAAHLSQTLAGDVTHLTVARIDPHEAVRRYRAHAMATRGRLLGEDERAALAEDLMSPCTDEVAVFHEFSRAIQEARRRFVVIDTAPTGHTLLLLDTAGSYHRDITRQLGGRAGLRTPLMRLQDPDMTKVILVTLAEPTPVLEAEGLQDDLQRAGIRPWAWVVNDSIAATRPRSPFLAMRAAHEIEQIARVRAAAERVALVPLLAHEPIGTSRLLALVAGHDDRE